MCIELGLIKANNSSIFYRILFNIYEIIPVDAEISLKVVFYHLSDIYNGFFVVLGKPIWVQIVLQSFPTFSFSIDPNHSRQFF